MLKIQDKAISYAKKNGLDFIVAVTSSPCGWVGTVKNLSVRSSKSFKNNGNYREQVFEGIKVFVPKVADIKGDIYIFQNIKLPFIGPIWGIRGKI